MQPHRRYWPLLVTPGTKERTWDSEITFPGITSGSEIMTMENTVDGVYTNRWSMKVRALYWEYGHPVIGGNCLYPTDLTRRRG